MSMETDLQLACRLADVAGAAIRPFYRGSFGLESKEDASPVTLADRAAEEAMRLLLKHEAPRDGIIGEEFGAERDDASRVWVLDPIDGTTSFVAGRPIFGTLIALIQDGWPVLGIIDQPIAQERWIGAIGQPTLFNNAPAQTRCCRDLSDAILGTTSPHLFTEHEAEHFVALAGKVARRRIVYGGDCYNYGLVASGHIDLVVESGLKLHDFAALIPIVEGAGGMMCDWAGHPLNAQSAGDVIALGDPARLEDVVDILSHQHCG
ncbi:MAG: hypothetical protein RLZZ561_299 [Pseudomonadota bacterium]|jgi:histidinol phosphatase-like enzyme (inositol monophosphatase family)